MAVDIEQALRQLAAKPPPLELADLNARVFGGIEAQRRLAAQPVAALLALAAVSSATLGIASSFAASSPTAEAAPILSPFGPSTPLAPSTLLGDAI